MKTVGTFFAISSLDCTLEVLVLIRFNISLGGDEDSWNLLCNSSLDCTLEVLVLIRFTISLVEHEDSWNLLCNYFSGLHTGGVSSHQIQHFSG